MHAPVPHPRRLPQRVVVAAAPGEQLSAYLDRLAEVLDLPLVPLADLAGPAEVDRLAAFDGWVTTGEEAWARPALLERADLVALVDLVGPETFTGRVRRTLRRLRTDARERDRERERETDLAWVEGLALTHPGLAVVRLPDPAAAETWLRALSA
ncbi:hypothetical protein [Pimelobacter sp. 30-1]|uniref:hypothetical protein n=1 Tax=Pimelobacter sp. 30-1 TaxID=2004991 RepID=UPI001C058A21|nr:hypothetical protein [Pimelobacter sp. 30-1]MBU2696352.1 hypothetical protein [Pimelobacter sp. 30-1]